jgi:hypothetical protein
LSVAALTVSSPERLERWIMHALAFADELIIHVDSTAPRGTLELARRYADRVRVFEHPPNPEVGYDAVLREASGDWILKLDDDEFLSTRLIGALGELLADPDATHYRIPVFWVVRTEDEGLATLGTFPWNPDTNLRLVRNIRGLFAHPAEKHAELAVAGEGRGLDPAKEGGIYHLALAQDARARREDKVERYRQGEGRSNEEYYLYEDYEPDLGLTPVSPDDLALEPHPLALQRAEHRRQLFAGRPTAAPRVMSVESLRTAVAHVETHPPIFDVEWRAIDVPASMLGNRGYTTRVEITNSSRARWRVSGDLHGSVRLSYHWDNENGRVVHDGVRTPLAMTVRPGESTIVTAGVWAPYDSGSYTLRFDLVCEGVGWFSERGASTLDVSVGVVSARSRLLDWRR